METSIRILKYLVAVIVVAALGGSASYFFYIRSHHAAATSPAPASAETPALSAGGSAAQPSSGASSASPTSAGAPQSAQRPVSQLWQVSKGPVAGYSFVTGEAASSTHLYFVERSSGNVFDADATLESVLRLTDTLVPKTYEALFTSTPGTALLRTMQSGSIVTLIGSFVTPQSTSTFPGALSGPTLPENIRSIALDGSGKSPEVFYLVPQSGQVVGMRAALAGGTPTQLFSSRVGSWRVFMARGAAIVLESPSDGVAGYAYIVSKGGARTLYAGPAPGLQILPHPTQAALLYSSSSGGQLSLYAKIGTHAPILLPLATIAEKCAWAPGSALIAYCAVPQSAQSPGFLDSWYQGVVHTSDTWWQVDAVNATTQEIYTPTSPFDVHDPSVDPSGTYLAFENGADRSLWVLRVVQ